MKVFVKRSTIVGVVIGIDKAERLNGDAGVDRAGEETTSKAAVAGKPRIIGVFIHANDGVDDDAVLQVMVHRFEIVLVGQIRIIIDDVLGVVTVVLGTQHVGLHNRQDCKARRVCRFVDGTNKDTTWVAIGLVEHDFVIIDTAAATDGEENAFTFKVAILVDGGLEVVTVCIRARIFFQENDFNIGRTFDDLERQLRTTHTLLWRHVDVANGTALGGRYDKKAGDGEGCNKHDANGSMNKSVSDCAQSK